MLEAERAARAEAERYACMQDDFLATLSHELRTPLNVIVGRTQMLGMVAHDPVQVTETAKTIARNGEALSRLVEDLLDVSRITIAGVQLDWQMIDVASLVDAATAGIRPAVEAKGIKLIVGTGARVPRILGVSTRLHQVVLNLLTNSMKFTPSGGEIRVDVRDETTEVAIVVTDTGQGIDRAFLPHVFEMFRQAEPTTSRTHGGLGIGLSIVRRLIELHGGRVPAESLGAGAGATFTVYLPCQVTPPQPAQSLVEQRQSV
jgi:signal transduction histidine kinase